MANDQERNESAPRSGRLEELLNVQKKMLLHTRITTVFNMLLSVVLLVAVVMTIHWMSAKVEHVESSLTAIDQMVDDATVLIDNANTMVTDNADTVAETVEKLNEVDIEGLNEAIDNLNTAIQPLSNFAGLFQR